MKHQTPQRPCLLAPFAGLALALGLAPVAGATLQGVHVVPVDHATIQEAIDASAPGDVVLVRGGSHTGTIVIDRPLTLMARPRASLHPPAESGFQPPAVQLAGSGAGTVVLCGLDIGGVANGLIDYACSAGIEGGGFDALHLLDCDVAGPTWSFLTGVASGAPALRTSVAQVLVQGSTLRGANSGNDDCYGSGPPGPSGIQAMGATVTVLDSTVRGGGSQPICGYGSCPVGGAGGAGIDCLAVLQAGSTIEGGRGATYFIAGDPTPCGTAPDGAPSTGTVTTLPGVLSSDGPPGIGRAWRLSWTLAGPGYLVGDLGLVPPTPAPPPGGLLFFDGSPAFLQAVPASGTASPRFPLDPSLVGRTVVMQGFTPRQGFERPLVGCIGFRPVRERRAP